MKQSRDELVTIYSQIIYTFNMGLCRLWGAEAASCRLSLALLEYHNAKAGFLTAGSPYEQTLENLSRVPYSSLDSMNYIRDISHLVYATSLLDTFLNDSTVFLFLIFPESIGKNQQVPLSNLLAAATRSQIITQAVMRKAREISYLSFGERLKFLRETFGLKLTLDKDAEDALQHYPSVRNVAVHDQGIFELSVDEDGHVHSRQKTCARHPTPLKTDDVGKAAKGYEMVVKEVARVILADVLKASDHDILKVFSSVKKVDGLGDLRNPSQSGKT